MLAKVSKGVYTHFLKKVVHYKLGGLKRPTRFYFRSVRKNEKYIYFCLFNSIELKYSARERKTLMDDNKRYLFYF